MKLLLPTLSGLSCPKQSQVFVGHNGPIFQTLSEHRPRIFAALERQIKFVLIDLGITVRKEMPLN